MPSTPNPRRKIALTSEVSDLTARLERLERENRRTRRLGRPLAAAGGLLGLAAPAPCDTVFAERLVLRDTAGRQRIVADAYSGAPALSLFSGEGRVLARIGVGQDGDACLTFFDRAGDPKGTWKGEAHDAARPETRPDGHRETGAGKDRPVTSLEPGTLRCP